VQRGHRHAQRRRIGVAHVLAGEDDDAPQQEARVLAALQHARQPIHGGVRVGAAHRFLVGGDDIVMFVALAVVAHGARRADVFGVLFGDDPLIPDARRGQHANFDGVDGFPDVAAARTRDEFAHTVLCFDFFLHFGGEVIEGAVDGRQNFLRGQRFKFKNSRAAEHRVVDVKIRVFRCRGNERNRTVLDELKQRLLLLFVEILNLVEVQQDAVGREDGVNLRYDGLDVRR